MCASLSYDNWGILWQPLKKGGLKTKAVAGEDQCAFRASAGITESLTFSMQKVPDGRLAKKLYLTHTELVGN